jgi:hypothetical protein
LRLLQNVISVFSADFVNNYRKLIWVGQYKNQNLTFWLKFTFNFFLALFVSEKLSKNYEIYHTNTQVSVIFFYNFVKLEVAIPRLRVTDAPPGM